MRLSSHLRCYADKKIEEQSSEEKDIQKITNAHTNFLGENEKRNFRERKFGLWVKPFEGGFRIRSKGEETKEMIHICLERKY
jgi:hypothetical protein